MGLLSGLVRLSYLQQRKLTLEYKIQKLSSTQMNLADRSVNLVTIGSDLDPKSPEYRALEARREKLKLMEKKLQAEMTRYQALLKAADTEIQSAQKIVDSSIKFFFSYSGGR